MQLVIEKSNEIKIATVARRSDVDTQRHTNSRIYENSLMDSRYKIFEKSGINQAQMLEKNLLIRPIRSKVKFVIQTKPGEKFCSITNGHLSSKNSLFWETKIQSHKNETICEILLESELIDSLGNIFFQKSSIDSNSFESIAIPKWDRSYIRTANPFIARFLDRD